MGVVGLTTFINEQLGGRVLKRHKLHDTKLVIDALNMLHYLYSNFNLNYCFGGDYDLFAKHLRNFFHALKECKIEPIMVFDGAYNLDDSKFETLVRRFTSRLTAAMECSAGLRKTVLPILARQVFVQILQELNITKITSDFEADMDMAAIANFYQCPVLSNDSDFYIFDVKAGFIPIDFLDINKIRDEDTNICYLGVKLYKLEYFVQDFQCKDPSMPALLAIICGNDYIQSEKFDDFYNKLNLPNKRVTYNMGKNKVTLSRNKERIGRIYSWLSHARNFDAALEGVLVSIKAAGRDDLKKLVLKFVGMYTDFERDNVITKYIKTREISAKTSLLYDRLPTSFLQSFRDCDVDPDIFNAMFLRRVWLQPQPENEQSPSAYECSRPIRQVCYGILEQTVTEYDRRNRTKAKRIVAPISEIADFGPVPKLCEISSVDLESRRRLFLTALGFTELNCEYENMTFWIAICTYWVQNSYPQPSLNHLRAFLLCYIRLGVLQPIKMLRQRTGATRTRLPTDLYMELKSCTSARFNEVTQRFVKIRDMDPSTKYLDRVVLQIMTQFQSCYLAASQLSQLLNNPFPRLLPDSFFNGILIHNVMLDLNKRTQPAGYIEEWLLGRNSELCKYFTKLMDIVLSTCAEDKRPSEVITAKKRNKRSGRGKKRRAVVEEAQSEESEHEEVRLDVEVNCDVTNKFGSLSMSE